MVGKEHFGQLRTLSLASQSSNKACEGKFNLGQLFLGIIKLNQKSIKQET